MTFRVIENELGFYPQVKFSIFHKWRRIAKHVCGYGLYDTLYYPDEKPSISLETIKDYLQWRIKSKSKIKVIQEFTIIKF